jgi:adhesin/invasin
MLVNFSFVTTPPSGATFSILGTGTTDASGKAIAVYTAGGTDPTADVQDTFQAEVDSGGYSAYGAVVINRTGTASTTTIPAGYILTLTASLSSVPAEGHSILTAKVTDGAGNPTSGLTVTFAIPSNNSGATRDPLTATTDAAGRAVSTYTAGSTDSGNTVYDAVTASVSGAADAVVITRTASSYTPAGNVITVTPTPVSLVAEALSAVVAQVSDASGNPVVGETVTFDLEVNNSGATLSPLTATTDGSGKAFSIYTAGTTESDEQVDDAVSASVTGASGAALITRLPAAGTGKRIFSFIQDPVTSKTSPIAPPWNQVQMKVKVTTDNGITPVTNEEVSFSIIIGEGTIIDAALNPAQEGDTALTVLTDNNGEAYVYFERPSEIGLGDTVVRAQIESPAYGGDATSIVYWRGFTPTITLEASATSVEAEGSSTLTATLTDGNGNAIIGETVTFTLDVDNSGANLIVINGTTGGDGRAVATYTAGTTAPSMDSVSASATYMSLDTADAVTITVTAPTP